MGVKLTNNASTFLASSISYADTSLTVTDASSFPALGAGEYFYCTLESTGGSIEIVKVTSIAGTIFSVTRGQENTAAIAFSAGATVELRLTVQNILDAVQLAISTQTATTRTVLGIEVADYTALKALTAGAVASVRVLDARDGPRLATWLSGDQSANITTDTLQGLYVPPDSAPTGASGCWYFDPPDNTGNVKWFGAVADWSSGAQTGTDNAAAFNAVFDHFDTCFVPKGSYKVASTITLDGSGMQILGEGQDDTSLVFSGTSGPGILITQNLCCVSNITINASTARNAAGYGTGRGIQIGGAGAGTLTMTRVKEVTITRQPGDGLVMMGAGAETVFSQLIITYNRGHGIFADDGTRDGLSLSRCGIVAVNNVISAGNGGHAVDLSPSGNTCYRWEFNNLESYDCAWNVPELAVSNRIARIRGQQITFSLSAFGDDGYADTTLGNGDVRDAKATAAYSVHVQSNSSDVALLNCRHLNTIRGAQVGTSVEGFYVRGGYFNSTTAVGYSVDTGCSGIDIEIPDASNLTTPVNAESVCTVVIGGVRGVTIPGASNVLSYDTLSSATIASGTLNCFSSVVLVSGQGGAADHLLHCRGPGVVELPDGFVISLLNLNAYDITIEHATTNIFTNTAADVVLGQNMGISFAVYGSNLYQV